MGLRLVDLSLDLFQGMPSYRVPDMYVWKWTSHEGTNELFGGRCSFESLALMMSEHSSTHMDAPYHFDPDGPTIDRVPLERLALPGVVLDVRGKRPEEPITAADLAAAHTQAGSPDLRGKALLLWTGWDELWPTPQYNERPYLHFEAGEWIGQAGVTLLGLDIISIERPADLDRPSHMTVLRKYGIPIVEALASLGAVAGREFTFLALPLKIRGGSGSPVRAVALLP